MPKLVLAEEASQLRSLEAVPVGTLTCLVCSRTNDGKVAFMNLVEQPEKGLCQFCIAEAANGLLRTRMTKADG